MRGRLRGKEIYLITGLISIIMVVVWYFLLFSPLRERITELKEETVQAQTALTQASSEVARLEAYKRTAPQSRAEIVRLSKMLPETEGIPSLIVELSQTAKDSGVDLLGITRGEAQLGTPFGLQTITLQVSGHYFDIEDFLYRLESYVVLRNQNLRVTGRLLQVANLSLAGGTTAATSSSSTSGSSSSPSLTVSVVLNAYLWDASGGGGASLATSAPSPASASEGEK